MYIVNNMNDSSRLMNQISAVSNQVGTLGAFKSLQQDRADAFNNALRHTEGVVQSFTGVTGGGLVAKAGSMVAKKVGLFESSAAGAAEDTAAAATTNAAAAATTTVGADLTAASASMDWNPVGVAVTAVLGIGTILAGVFGHKKEESVPRHSPDQPTVANVSTQFGV